MWSVLHTLLSVLKVFFKYSFLTNFYSLICAYLFTYLLEVLGIGPPCLAELMPAKHAFFHWALPPPPKVFFKQQILGGIIQIL